MFYLYVNVLSDCNQPNVADTCCQEVVFGLVGLDYLDYSQIITIKFNNGMPPLVGQYSQCQQYIKHFPVDNGHAEAGNGVHRSTVKYFHPEPPKPVKEASICKVWDSLIGVLFRIVRPLNLGRKWRNHWMSCFISAETRNLCLWGFCQNVANMLSKKAWAGLTHLCK